MLKLKDENFQIGDKIFRIFSVDHLRYQNLHGALPHDKVVERLKEYRDEPHGVVASALSRLEVFPEKSKDDHKTVVKMIYHGQMYGLGASPQPPVLAALLWQAAALILEEYGAEHPNDLPKML